MNTKLACVLSGLLSASFLIAAQAAPSSALLGDINNGRKLYAAECAACHGENGEGGRIGVALSDSGRLNQLSDAALFQLFDSGQGTKSAKEHAMRGKLSFLSIWDLVAFVRAKHLGLVEFFPEANRYLAKDYTIDQFGLERIKQNTQQDLKNPAATVYTFFKVPKDKGTLRYVPQDPIELDQLKKDQKSGYLVFVPFEFGGVDGELAVAMQSDGQIKALKVHPERADATTLNRDLLAFVGKGKKGDTVAFKAPNAKLASLSRAVFVAFQQAMETATMYDREERERTWADE